MSENLRDALEELVSEREAEGGATPSDYAISPHEVRELLAAHPVEPDVSMRVIREHEPRHMGCACGAPMGDSIDYRWHLVNQTIAAVRSS